MENLKRLIINADDFGRHELINQAVEKGVTEGCLRSATLMPGGKAFESAVAVARRQKELGVGIHFTLVNGYPILPPQEIPSLVTAEGVFFDDYTVLVKHFLAGRVNLEEVRAELAAQLNKLEGAGLSLTHADSHQHMHTLPGVIDTALSLFSGEFGGLGQLIGRIGLGTLACLSAWKAKRKGMATPDHFAGIVAGEAVSEAYLLDFIRQLQPGTTEVMMHPGLDNQVLVPDCAWEHDFEAELAAIVSPAVLELAASEQVEIANFRAWAE